MMLLVRSRSYCRQNDAYNRTSLIIMRETIYQNCNRPRHSHHCSAPTNCAFNMLFLSKSLRGTKLIFLKNPKRCLSACKAPQKIHWLHMTHMTHRLLQAAVYPTFRRYSSRYTSPLTLARVFLQLFALFLFPLSVHVIVALRILALWVKASRTGAIKTRRLLGAVFLPRAADIYGGESHVTFPFAPILGCKSVLLHDVVVLRD